MCTHTCNSLTQKVKTFFHQHMEYKPEKDKSQLLFLLPALPPQPNKLHLVKPPKGQDARPRELFGPNCPIKPSKSLGPGSILFRVQPTTRTLITGYKQPKRQLGQRRRPWQRLRRIGRIRGGQQPPWRRQRA